MEPGSGALASASNIIVIVHANAREPHQSCSSTLADRLHADSAMVLAVTDIHLAQPQPVASTTGLSSVLKGTPTHLHSHGEI